MSGAEPRSAVFQRVCPSCDVEPPADLVEPVCVACGARLVELRPQVDDLIGKVIDGRFEIRDRIGEGGMGTVYRAWQRSIGREVAIKLIDQRHVRDAMGVRRFLREARLASQLSQPNTISVFDFGQADDGRLFIAMELVRGRTLGDIVKADGPFSVTRALRIGVQLCDALDAAHRLQIVHRDLKPSNVLVLDDPPGRDLVKVLDFGLAKSMTDDETESTMTGLVVGTPRYMAPEVALGGDPSPAGDLYAVGVLLAEITTGMRLWDAQTFSQLVALKNRGLPKLATLPAILVPLLERLVAPEPHRRPACAATLRVELLELAGGDESAPFALPPAASLDTPTLDSAPSGETSRLPVPARPSPLPLALPPTPTLPLPLGPGDPGSVSLGVSTVRRERTGIMVAAAIIALGAVAAVIAVAASRGGTGAAAPATPDAAVATILPVDAAQMQAPPSSLDAGTAPADATAAAAIETVILRIRSSPAGARVLIGDLAGTTPFDVEVPRSTTALTVTMTLGGGRHRAQVVPDRDREVDHRFGRKGRPTRTGGKLPF